MNEETTNTIIAMLGGIQSDIGGLKGDIGEIKGTVTGLASALDDHKKDDDKVAATVIEHDRQLASARGWVKAVGALAGMGVLGHLTKFIHHS